MIADADLETIDIIVFNKALIKDFMGNLSDSAFPIFLYLRVFHRNLAPKDVRNRYRRCFLLSTY